jgi:hypothetical protein
MGRPSTKDWNSGTWVCPTCPAEIGAQPLENFSRDAKRPNGRANRCRKCGRRDRDQAKRTRVRSRVVKHVLRQPKTREEIAELTGLDEEVVSSELAKLWDRDLVKIDPVNRTVVAA